MSTQFILVPIHLDAFFVPKETMAVEAFADFSRLPFYTNGVDFNPDVPNLSESVLNTPFQNQNLVLKPGLHLHWSLPDALTGGASGTIESHPAVPNRWLIRFIHKDDNKIVREWKVESDYLHVGLDNPYGGITYPLTKTDPTQEQPFGFLGRQFSTADEAPQTSGSFISKLTAAGYGEPAFASFYPNCHSVFGGWDEDILQEADLNGTYQIIGWHSNEEQDPAFLRFRELISKEKPADKTKEKIAQAFEEAFFWKANFVANEGKARMVCYAELELNNEGEIKNPDKGSSVRVSLGNTGTEALSAYLADALGGDKKITEEKLESLLLKTRLQDKALDLGARFNEARHEKGFRAESGGSIWQITQTKESEQSTGTTQVSLSAELANALNQLNAAQQENDQLLQEIKHGQQLLFADWYKYMLCAYPPESAQGDFLDIDFNIDQIKWYIEQKHLPSLEETMLNFQTQLDELAAQIGKLNQNKEITDRNYELKKVSGPRFWQPTEPVVLLEGNTLKTTNNATEKDTLVCKVFSSENISSLLKKHLTTQVNQVNYAVLIGLGKDTWVHQPWQPFLLEWEVEVLPLNEGGAVDGDHQDFKENFITDNYQLEENSPELTPHHTTTPDTPGVYWGRSILTPYAKKQLSQQIEDYVKYRTDGVLKEVKEKHLDKNFASQALSGFNNALLMQHQTLQLPVNDPLGFDVKSSKDSGVDGPHSFTSYQAFTNKVRELLTGDLKGIKNQLKNLFQNNNLAPLPFNNFLPIRSGQLKLNGLRLIDQFGQVQDIAIDKVIKAETLNGATLQNNAWLPPRVMQPTRLNFRWLAAESGLQEFNVHPASSPICGWLLANHLDNSLVVYDQRGIALGVIDQAAKWRTTPGIDVLVDPQEIDNSTLSKVVTRLTVPDNASEEIKQAKRAFLQHFISKTDKTLENIDPESFGHHQELALLMGRPMAIVRALVGLQVKGRPAVNHGWTALYQDLHRDERETSNFEQVKIPIRIGERGQLNDGVVGYWQETPEDFQLGANFYTTVALDEPINGLKSYEQAPLNLTLSLNDAAQTLTMLIDPRGEVHATTGILPAKSIRVPKDEYVKALQKINITFLSAPILSAANETALALPNEAGYRWSWLAKHKNHWVEVAQHGVLRKNTLANAFGNWAAIWQELITQGWIKPLPALDAAEIVPTDQRTKATLSEPFVPQATQIQELLDSLYITPPENFAAFKANQMIKEGWLKLSHVEEPGSG